MALEGRMIRGSRDYSVYARCIEYTEHQREIGSLHLPKDNWTRIGRALCGVRKADGQHTSQDRGVLDQEVRVDAEERILDLVMSKSAVDLVRVRQATYLKGLQAAVINIRGPTDKQRLGLRRGHG